MDAIEKTINELKPEKNPVLAINERLLSLLVLFMDALVTASVRELTERKKDYSTRVRELADILTTIKALVP